jgi:hypothetical protein
MADLQEQDEKWEKRGNTALVYDSTYERHWDTWAGPKTTSLFSVRFSKDADGKWQLGSKYINLLNDTGHVSSAARIARVRNFTIVCRVAPLGRSATVAILMLQTIMSCIRHSILRCLKPGTQSKTLVCQFGRGSLLIYSLQIYYVDIERKEPARKLTLGTQGATHSPVSSHKGDKVAWLEMDKDGYESDRCNAVVDSVPSMTLTDCSEQKS